MTHEERRIRRAKIAEFIVAGKSVKAAVAEFAVCSNTVNIACREHGINVTQEPRMSPFRVLAAILNRVKGETQSDVARKLNITRQYVSLVKQAAESEGISTRPRMAK